MANLSRLVRHHALRDPDRIALAFAGEQVSYGELWRRTRSIAAMLRTDGGEAGRAGGAGDEEQCRLHRDRAGREPCGRGAGADKLPPRA